MRRELLQSKFLFFSLFCGGTIYNLVINLFYVPPSPVIGCHWSCVRGGNVFMALFLISQATFLQLHSQSVPFKSSRRRSLSLISRRLVASAYFAEMSRDRYTSVLFRCVENMLCRGEPAWRITDYLTFEGRLWRVWTLYSSLCVFR